MEQNLFQKIISDAALDSGRNVKFVERFEQAADHPIDTGIFQRLLPLKALPARYSNYAIRNISLVQ